MERLLDRIESPGDLKQLTLPELTRLAQEMREAIVETVAKNGGHLGPSLGVVELTLAVHRVFDSPRDKIIWDVGHQSYPHKLVTGRRNRFHTLRQLGGLSGFPRREESPHDHFGTAHASTAISAAVGMAIARDLAGEDHEVVAIVGDGALTGGIAFEGLDHAGHDRPDLIVVLNDNSMSISPNVGAISRYLQTIRTDRRWHWMKDLTVHTLGRLPVLGRPMLRALERFKDSVKYYFVPGMFFEELGFTYLGPVDGHDIEAVELALRQARDNGGPVLVHCLTEKGRGYQPAESSADRFHGGGPFDPATGARAKSGGPPTYSDVFGETLMRLADRDERVVAITAAMLDGTGLNKFHQRFPGRTFDVGIAEAHATLFAAGLSTQGMRPVFAVYSTFLQRGYDPVIHDVCIQNLPVLFALDRAGVVGDDGQTHNGVFDIAYLRCLPNMVLAAPADERELQDMLFTGLQHDGPFAVRYPRGKGAGVPLATSVDELRRLPIGRGELLRPGDDLAILAYGTMVRPALLAAESLAAGGISAAVWNARFAKPLDALAVQELARSTGRVLTVEEGQRAGGFGSAVLEALSDAGLTPATRVLGLPDRFVEHGPREHWLRVFGLDAEGIERAARELLEMPAGVVDGAAPGRRTLRAVRRG